jgi:ABC-type hemin transport system ATPase subunit
VRVTVTGRGRQVTHAVAGVDHDVRAGEIVALVGQSGSGKTTLTPCGRVHTLGLRCRSSTSPMPPPATNRATGNRTARYSGTLRAYLLTGLT